MCVRLRCLYNFKILFRHLSGEDGENHGMHFVPHCTSFSVHIIRIYITFPSLAISDGNILWKAVGHLISFAGLCLKCEGCDLNIGNCIFKAETM
jgi:hypothetical protein